MSFNFNDPNPRNLDLGQSFGSNPLPKPPGFNNTGDGFSHVVNDNGTFGSNGGIQSMDRNTFNNTFGNILETAQPAPYTQNGVQSPFDYQGYTNPNANQQPVSPQYPTQAGGFDVNQPRPSWWNQGEAGAPGTPDFVRNPKTQQDWEQRYYYLQQHPEDFNQQAPINAWYQQNDPRANAALQQVASGQSTYPGMDAAGAQRQLRMWDAMRQGGGIEPGSAASPYGRIHMPNGQIVDVGTGQIVPLPAPPRPTYGGYSAPRATYTATPKATTAAPNFGTAAVNALLKPPAAPAPYMASSPPEILGYGAQAPVALPDSNLLRRLMQYGTYGLKLGVR